MTEKERDTEMERKKSPKKRVRKAVKSKTSMKGRTMLTKQPIVFN